MRLPPPVLDFALPACTGVAVVMQHTRSGGGASTAREEEPTPLQPKHQLPWAARSAEAMGGPGTGRTGPEHGDDNIAKVVRGVHAGGGASW